MAGVFEQIAVVLAACVVAGALATAVRLPPLVGLLLAGIAVGPSGVGVVTASEEIAVLGEIGIALLLFVVGLELDPRVVRRLGPVVLAAGLAQVALTAAIGFAIATAFGATPVAAGYLAAATAFSSTVVVIKLLGDRRELEQLHGRIAVGILIVQDLVVVVLLIAVTAGAGGDGAGGFGTQAVGLVLRGAVLLVGVAAVSRTVLPAVTRLLARQTELLVLGAVTWAVAAAAAAHLLGFSAEVGAILAGVGLSTSPFHHAISGRLATLRDFLLVFFFIDLGTHLEIGGGEGLGIALALSVFVLVVKPLLVAVLTTGLGFRASVGIRSGLQLAQISEFSLILVALGVGLGQLDPAVAGTVTIVGVITITASTYLSARSERLTDLLRGPLLRLERATRDRDLTGAPVGFHPTIVLIGFGRLGQQLAVQLEASGERVLAVDYDPRHHRSPSGHPLVVYGDAEDPELPEQLPLHGVRWVVSTLRDNHANRALADSLGRHGYTGRLAVSADHDHEVEELAATGADLVVRPFHAAAGPLIRQLEEHDAAG